MGKVFEKKKQAQACAKKLAEKKTKKPPEANPNERPLVEFPHILRTIGPKHVKILMQFLPSAVLYGVTSLLLVTYISEWKSVLQFLPYYNGKYYVEPSPKKDEEE